MDHVLFVCTGNLCRSPMAEALLRARLARVGADDVVVSSAGTMGFAAAATGHAALVAGEMGGDLTEHRARRLDAGLIESVDLVVAMTADHVIDILYQAPGAAPRVFKLSELARLATPARRRHPGETLGAWAAELSAGRSDRPWADSRHDPDVADPMGETLDVYREIAAEIDALLEPVVLAAWPRVSTSSPQGPNLAAVAFQLRRYQLRAGTFDEFLAVWRESVVPLRQKFGFEVVGAWGVPGTDDFVWIVYHPGDFVGAEQAYYQAPERAALDPDPASFIENADITMMTAVG